MKATTNISFVVFLITINAIYGRLHIFQELQAIEESFRQRGDRIFVQLAARQERACEFTFD